MTDVYKAPGIGAPPPVLFGAAFGVGVLIEKISPSPDPPTWLRVAAGGAGASLLVALDTFATARFRDHKTPFNPARAAQALVTDGPYRLTRNPMYVGMSSAYAGAAVASGSLWSLPLLAAPLLVLNRILIPREEAHLTAKFGAEYLRYRASVRRWL